MPLRRDGAVAAFKSFWYGQLSGRGGANGRRDRCGPGGLLAQPILPYALAFAAGAMIYVVVEEVIPESQGNNNTDLATGGAMAGFAIMMVLDVALS